MNYQKTLAVVAGLMLLIAIPSVWPYGYYQILRWVVAIAAGLSAYSAHKRHMNVWLWVMIAVAILFNPIAPIYLSKEIWIIIDLVVAMVFFVSIPKLKYISI